ncbi:MAG: YggS family pyridoxal phosphate-dependent enzyme [Myxococcota bacterium]|nr:YggS family pyridoxal phosphate-dependent enzyme [Myxococcota bacterium]
MSIAVQLEQINTRINVAAKAAGRDSSEIKLLAASKYTDSSGIEESILAGQMLFGENRAQALRDKHQAIAMKYPTVDWHFIGHLQKNKIKYICGRAKLIHTIDSPELAHACHDHIHRTEKEPIGVLVQVKLGEEDTKTGCAKDNVMYLCDTIMSLPNLRLEGLMNIAPLYGEPEQWFTEMAEMAHKGRQNGFPLHTLSMGMSSDMEVAIACGATIIRVGSLIYRPQK